MKLEGTKDLRPDWKDVAIAMSLEGKLQTEIRREIGVSRRYHEKFREEDEEYRLVFEECKANAEAWWDEMGRKNIDKPAKEFNTILYIFIMKSVFKRRDRHQEFGAVDDELADPAKQKEIRDKYRSKDQQSDSIQ